MSASTHTSDPASTPGRERVVMELAGRAVAAVGVIVGMGLYLAVAPLIAAGTGLVGLLSEVRDAAVRPRPFVGARHGMPFLDRRPAEPEREDALHEAVVAV